MQTRLHPLRGAQSLPAGQLDSHCLNVVRARGRGSALQVPPGWITLCVVLSGALVLESHDANWMLAQGRYQLWLEGSLRCAAHGQCWWLLVTAPPATWTPDARIPGADLLPWEAGCPRTVLRPIVRLARRAHAAEFPAGRLATDLVADLRQALAEHQAELQGRMGRCSGRTRLRRRQTLLRLLRVQHLIRCHLDDHIALSRLAASANYSPCHLIRVHRHVFGETPTEYASRLRCQRAWELVCDTAMPVCEIAGSLGFESESAFCRAFKHAFGCTTGMARRRLAGNPAGAAVQPGSGNTSISALPAA
ncbi:AraC family transcriptional regulator [Luteimonas sp. MC1750]|uniref:helix-turn-helix domain-containing protein n=1 Tax=Luteimonas sp. MC1750 TaxID=2799326 RepID=UPI0018F08FEA|nr:AraC family transcriptional regulator [Luteimonas sp. MC1750]MBJ6984699.1 helix-turn-helix transcriptional regulator [Luteimonas sp. MC1750]QQO04704.1 helix-turn-helix transcriptional regulator [Luteimonas sp. MC1750]